MEAFEVRYLTDHDLHDFMSIRLEALRLYPHAFGAAYEDWSQRPTRFFADLLISDSIIGGFDSQNTLQGMIGVRFNGAPKLRHIATIWGVYVRADMRGSGLSQALMNRAIEAACAVRIIKLSVGSANYSAQALYRSFGFEKWAVDADALCVNDIFYDEILMRRLSTPEI